MSRIRCGLLLAAAALAAAEEADAPPTPEEGDAVSAAAGWIEGIAIDQFWPVVVAALPRWHAGAGATVMAPADAEDGDGELAVMDVEAHFAHLVRLEPTWGIVAALTVSQRRLDDDDLLGLPDDLAAIGATAAGWHRLSDDWHLLWLAHLGLRGDADDLDGDALRGAGGAGVIWRASPRWTLLGGLLLASTGDGVFPVPIVGATWMPNERWTVLLLPVAPGVRWKPLPDWTFGAGLKLAGGEYALDDDALDDAILTHDARLYVGADYASGLRWSAGAELGVAVARRFSWLDDDGDERADLEIDPAPYLALNASVRW